jgi:hypothetical protein
MASSNLTSFYQSIVAELERRRRAVGIPMERMSDLAGTADRSYAKLLAPESASGRIGNWKTLQLVLDVLFPDGVEVRLTPLRPGAEPMNSGTRKAIIEAAVSFDATTLPDHMRNLQMLSCKARLESTPPTRRKAIASKAARARWAKFREAKRAFAQDLRPQPESP